MTEFPTFRRQAYQEHPAADSLMDHLEARVAALEESAAARWPRRILVRARLASCAAPSATSRARPGLGGGPRP